MGVVENVRNQMFLKKVELSDDSLDISSIGCIDSRNDLGINIMRIKIITLFEILYTCISNAFCTVQKNK